MGREVSMLTDDKAKEVLKICDDRKLLIHEHDDDSRRDCHLAIVDYGFRTHFLMDNEGTIIFHGCPEMIYTFLTKEVSYE